MLKIKDNVDLKELEKFGFKKNRDADWLEKWLDNNFRVCILCDNKNITIDCVSAEDINWTENLGFIYDLIQAGLVEKVEE